MPAGWALDWFRIHLTDPSKHADGGNFCPYLLISNDDDLIKYCRDKIQLSTELPKETEIETLNDGGSYMGYTKFMEYLKNKNINVFSLSALPKKFIQQSIRGGKVSVTNGTQQLINEKITGLDVNSLYPYALSLIDAPLGMPRLITDKMTLSDVKKKYVY